MPQTSRGGPATARSIEQGAAPPAAGYARVATLTESPNSVVVGRGQTVVMDAGPGAAFVFVRPQGGWGAAGGPIQPVATLTPRVALPDSFTSWVAIYEDTVVVGAQDLQSYDGTAFVYERPADGWRDGNEAAVLDSTDGESFGASAAIFGETIAVGAPTAGGGAGAVYAYVRPARGWTGSARPSARLLARDGSQGDALGTAVAVGASGTIVAGAPICDSAQGAVYVFERPGQWSGAHTESARLGASMRGALGAQVAILGDAIAASAPIADIGGAAYVYNAPWADGQQESATLVVDDATAPWRELGGDALVFDGEGTLLAAPGRSDGVYVFVRPAGGWSGSVPYSQRLGSGTGNYVTGARRAVAIVGKLEDADAAVYERPIRNA